jgi:hypothetical protein
VIRVDSNRTEERWPVFCRRALQHGVLICLSLPEVVDGAGLGAINFSGHTDRAATDADSFFVDIPFKGVPNQLARQRVRRFHARHSICPPRTGAPPSDRQPRPHPP